MELDSAYLKFLINEEIYVLDEPTVDTQPEKETRSETVSEPQVDMPLLLSFTREAMEKAS